MYKKKIQVGIIGAGNISIKYLETLKHIKEYKVASIFSRTYKKALALSKIYKINNIYHSIDEMINNENLDAIFILVSYNSIYKITKYLIPKKIPLLIEKPPGMSLKESLELSKLSLKYKTKNIVALNRRFYSNFEKGLRLINNYGGPENIIIEGHERFWKIKDNKNVSSKDKWIFANSIHTIDLIRYFGGEIKSIQLIKKSRLEKNGDQFSALIKYKNNASGFYFSNWYAPGGWSVKLFGNGITVIFSPLEKGYYIKKNMKKYEIKNSIYDTKFKPGFYKQLKVFANYIYNNELHPSAQSLNNITNTFRIIQKFYKSK